MSQLSTGAKTLVGYITEAVYGQTPNTGSDQLNQVPFSGISLNTTKEEILDSRIDGKRDVQNANHGNKTVTGELSGDFSAVDYDDFLRAAMLQPIASPASFPLKIGDSIEGMTLEEAQLDIGPKFRKVSGVVVNTMSIDAPIDGNATISFGFNAKEESYELGGTTDASSLDDDFGTNGYNGAPQNTPFTHVGGTLTGGSGEGPADDGDLVGIVQSISLELDNGYEPAFVWGRDTADCQIFRKAQVTGTLILYYDDSTLVKKFLDGTKSRIDFSLTDGTNTYTFTMENILYNGADMSVSDDGVRTISLPYRALYDATADTSLEISKS